MINDMKAKLLKPVPLYPFLFILFVILFALVNNQDQISPNQILRPLLVLFLVEAALVLLFRVINKDWQLASYLSFLTIFIFFLYGPITVFVTDKLPGQLAGAFPFIALGILAVLAILLGRRGILKRLGGFTRVTPFLKLVFAILVLAQVVDGVPEITKLIRDLSRQQSGLRIPREARTGVALDCTVSPDIYWIVLDGYGRADMLKAIYGVDTSSTLESLKEMGFIIAEQSHANYIQTVYSVPSTLYFNYLGPKPSKVSGYDYFPALIANNPLMTLLRQCGYKMVTFASGFYFTNYPGSDLYLSDGEHFNDLEELLFASTPLILLAETLDFTLPEWTYASHRSRVLYTFDQLGQLPELEGPKFVFAHILSPHPPFVFDAQGNEVEPRRSYSINDGDDYVGTWKEYRKGYASQIRYTSQLLEQTVSEILEGSEAQPVIIVQSDHGPGGHLVWESPDETCLWERTSILNAYYLPDGGSQALYPEISPVNSFRVVLNHYFGLDLDLLADQTYFTSHLTGSRFTNVTEERDSRKNCGG